MERPTCTTHEHRYRHLDTKHKNFVPKYGNKTHFKRVDQFYCTRCLQIEVLIREETTDTYPDWWNK